MPDGFTVTPIASDLKIPRQMLILPNGDILVAEGSGGSAPALHPKGIIAGLIKKRGKSPVEGGDRIALLRDSDGDGQTDLQTTFVDGLDAPYGLALVDSTLYVANQDNPVSFEYTEGATSIAGTGTELTKLPGKISQHWTKAMTAREHGRWNRNDPSGYKVVFVPLRNGRPDGEPIDLVTGFLKDGHARGRPLGVTYDPERRVLLVADDVSNTVWRVAPRSTGVSTAEAIKRVAMTSVDLGRRNVGSLGTCGNGAPALFALVPHSLQEQAHDRKAREPGYRDGRAPASRARNQG